MRKTEIGFTVVEMVAVVALIAILALMAVPSLQARAILQQVGLALPLADVAKTPVAAAWAADQPFPQDNTDAGIPVAEKIVGNYVSGVAIEDGAINITFGNQANKTIHGKILSLRPAVVPDEHQVPVAWVCGNGDVPDKMVVNGTNRTDIPPNFLPVECRGHNKS